MALAYLIENPKTTLGYLIEKPQKWHTCYKIVIQVISAKDFHKGDVVKHGKRHHGPQGQTNIAKALTEGVSNTKKSKEFSKEFSNFWKGRRKFYPPFKARSSLFET